MRLYLRHKWLGALYLELSTVHYNSLLFSINKSGNEWVCKFPCGTCILTSVRALRAERSSDPYAAFAHDPSTRDGAQAADHSGPISRH